jgi:succinoglycan biosynthesis protein ExoA
LARRHAENFVPPIAAYRSGRFSRTFQKICAVLPDSIVQASSSVFVSIVMPALNEERYVAKAIRSVLPASKNFDYELLVIDGGSIDQTRRVVEQIASSNRKIRILENPRRIQSAAMNIAAELCDPRSEILIRADCHALYPEGFVQGCVDALRRTGSASVVVAMQGLGGSPVQRAVAAAQNSRLANGGSQHRMGRCSGYVEHGHHAAFDRAVFRALGGYDETAPYNEDAEFDARLRRVGGRIYLDQGLTIKYYPRSSASSLARQYYCHGWGRANTLLKHGMVPKPRQILPVIALLMCLMALVAWPIAGAVALVPSAGYLTLCLAWGCGLAVRAKAVEVLLSGPAAITMHLSWAAGFLTRMARQGVPALFRGFGPRL